MQHNWAALLSRPHTGCAGGAKKAAPQPAAPKAAAKAAVKAAAKPQQQVQQQQERDGGAFWSMFKLPWQAQEDAASEKAAPQQAVQGSPAAAQGSKSAQVRAHGRTAGLTELPCILRDVTIAKWRVLCCGALHRVRRVAFLDKLQADTSLKAQRTQAKLAAVQGS